MTSPTPNKTMSFPEAIKAIIDGKKITKLEWNDPEVFGVLRDGLLMLYGPDEEWHKWIISDGDLTGEDWVTV